MGLEAEVEIVEPALGRAAVSGAFVVELMQEVARDGDACREYGNAQTDLVHGCSALELATIVSPAGRRRIVVPTTVF